MAFRQSLLLSALILAVAAPSAWAGVNITSLPISFIVTTRINGENITASSQLVYLQDNLEVTWRLNESFVKQDCNYQKILIRLCYGAPSFKGRPWRAPNTDLSLSKQCLPTAIATQPYISSCAANTTGLLPPMGSISVPMNMTVWQASREVPGALYFVRVFALNSTAPDASPGNNAVAMGQTTDPTFNENLFQVIPYSGITVSLDVVVIVLSVSSYIALFGFFFYERHMKKNK